MKNFKASLVIRKNKKTGKFDWNFASKLPLSQYECILFVGSFYGCQMGYVPYCAACEAAEEATALLNKGVEIDATRMKEIYKKRMIANKPKNIKQILDKIEKQEIRFSYL